MLKRLAILLAVLVPAIALAGGPVNPPGPIPITCTGGNSVVAYSGYGQPLTCGTGTATGTISAGVAGQLADYTAATTVGPITTGTGVVTALGVNVGTAGSVLVNGGALGTPSSGTLTNATGLPIATGISGLGAGVATFLATPSSANLSAAMTTKTGTGLNVFNTSPSISGLTLSDVATGTQCLHANSSGVVTGTGTDCGAGAGGGTGFGVDGGTSAASVTGTGAIGASVRLVKIATGWTTGTLTLPAISGVSTDTAIAIVDGGFVSGSATLTIAANAADTGASGGIISSAGTVASVGAFTNTGDGLVFRVSGLHTWTIQAGATIASSSAPANQFANGLNINGLTYAQPSIANLSGLGSGVATAAGNALSANGGLTTTIASGATAMATAAIASGVCAAAVQGTATGTLTTDVVLASFNGDPTAVTGYVPATTGMLTIVVYPTAGFANFRVCNNTSASITPGAITLNWRVVR